MFCSFPNLMSFALNVCSALGLVTSLLNVPVLALLSSHIICSHSTLPQSQHSKHVFVVVANSFLFLELYRDIICTPYSLPNEGTEFSAFRYSHRAMQPSPLCNFRLFFITTKSNPMPISSHFLILPGPASPRQPLCYSLNP